MKVKTSNLIGPALDWAVAMCRGFDGLDEDEWLIRDGIADMPLSAYTPSSDWAQGGPVIESANITVRPVFHAGRTENGSDTCRQDGWSAHVEPKAYWITPRPFAGSKPLIAAMRCYVTSKMGGEVEVPDELIKE